MYQFVDTNQNVQNKKVLSAESLFVNGSALENEIDELRVLSTSGREMNAVSLSTQDVDELDGVLFLGSKEEARTITVTCLLEAKTNKSFRLAFEKLNLILRQGFLKLVFNDDLDFYYEVYFKGASAVPEGTNNATFTLEFLCPKPFKYAKTVMKESTTIVNDYFFKTVPETLKVTVTNTMNDVTITNSRTGYFIKVITEKQIGGQIIIKPQENTAFYGALEKPRLISWDSDCEYFDVQKGDRLTVSPTTTIELEVRRKLL